MAHISVEQFNAKIEALKPSAEALNVFHSVCLIDKDLDALIDASISVKVELTAENLVAVLEENLTGIDKDRTLNKVKAISSAYYEDLIKFSVLRAFVRLIR